MSVSFVNEFQVKILPTLTYFQIEDSAIDRVCEAYNESWRAYHTTEHILGMLRGSAELPLTVVDKHTLDVLIIYHDIWYKISREHGENERRSAEWAIADLSSCSKNQENLFSLVQQGIEATITHTLDGVDRRFTEVVSYLLDLDLWGLGQPPAVFRKDTEAVWSEFKPRYTREEFDQGRSAWAGTFVQRSKIYHTEFFKHLEEQARENLKTLANQ